MEKELNQKAMDGIDEQLHDTLIAISVIAKRLATRLVEDKGNKDTEEKSNE